MMDKMIIMWMSEAEISVESLYDEIQVFMWHANLKESNNKNTFYLRAGIQYLIINGRCFFYGEKTIRHTVESIFTVMEDLKLK